MQPYAHDQLPLNLAQSPSYDLGDFLVTNSNRDAFEFLTGITNSKESWPKHFCALVGPKSSGKTHLIKGWADTVDAVELGGEFDVSELEPGSLYYLEDVDAADKHAARRYPDDQLFHLYNWAKEIGAMVVVTAQNPPTLWPRRLPDLMSRMAQVPVLHLKQPDDELMYFVLSKLFSDRQLEVNSKVIDYILPRTERSLERLVGVVEAMDAKALAEKRGVTVHLARAVLEGMEAEVRAT